MTSYTKQQMAEFLAKCAFRNGANTFNGRDTLEKWIDYYMTLTVAQLRHEMKSYSC